MIQWQEVFDCDIIIHAIEKAALANAKKVSYVEGILRNWKNKGIKTSEQAKADSENFTKKGNSDAKTDEEKYTIRADGKKYDRYGNLTV